MGKKTSEHLKDLGVSDLEHAVEGLLQLVDRLREENQALRARQTVLLEERQTLIGRNQQASDKVASVVERLKDLEQGT